MDGAPGGMMHTAQGRKRSAWSAQQRYGQFSRYGCAVASVALAVWVRLLLDPLLGAQLPFFTILLAVLVTAGYGGLRPALAAVALGAVALNIFLLQPRGVLALAFNQGIALAVFIGTGLGIALLGGSMHRARRQAESAARSSRSQAALIEQSFDAVLVWDWNGPIRFWNRGAERLYGFSALEAIGAVSHDLLKTDALGGIEAIVGVLEREGSWEGELRHVGRDGRALVVSSRMVLIREADQRYVLETNRDITARKQIENSLRAAHDSLELRVRERTSELQGSEAKFRSYIENAPIAVLMTDSTGHFVEANLAATAMLGYTSDELKGLPTSAIHFEGTREGVLRARDTLNRGGKLEGEFQMRRKDGGSVWALLRAVVLEDGGSLAYCVDITARKESDAALRAERDRFAKIVATVPMIICSFLKRADGSACYPFIDPRIELIFGVRPEELALDASPMVSLIHPDDIEQVRDSVNESARTLGTLRLEYRIRHPTRGQIWIEAHYAPVLQNNGNFLWHGYIADITERKSTEEALRASEASLRLLIEGVADHAIFMLDPTGKVLTWNNGAERIDGYTSHEIIGRDFSCLFTPEAITAGRPQQELERAAAEGKANVDGWRVRKNGARFWANGTLAALYDDQGGVRGFSKITRDLTAKRRNDELLRSVLDHTLDAIVGIDEQGTISMINRAGEIMFGRSEPEVIGNNVRMLMPAPYHAEHDGYLANYLRTGEARIIGIGREVSGLRKDGSTFPMDLAVTEFRLDNQRFFVGIVRDISERKKLESQLHQSQKMEAFGQLAGGVAHDFNNLLTVISGYSELLLSVLQPHDANREMINEIRRASERAASLTRQLLAFTRQQVLEPRVIDLNATIKDTESMLRRLIGEDMQFASMLRENISSVKVDPGQIEQVIINLAVNARDAMPNGGRLTIETKDVELTHAYADAHPDTRPGRYVMLAISDTGSGMAPEVRTRIFEPFFTTKGGKGTGLGLAVVQGIVKQSGGSIEVYSEIGAGTTFKVYLPAISERRAADVDPSLRSSPRGSETILLVEDEDGVRDLAVIALKGFGYRLLTAAGGSAALPLMAAHQDEVKLLVTDVVMPGMSGRQLAETLQAAYPALKVLFISGYTDDAVVRHGVLQANVAFLQKPFTPMSLARKVREVLDHNEHNP
jgi:two-component system, cell cycle sensor histidine kinase and response regulator CckA